jgi:hypothetical protein
MAQLAPDAVESVIGFFPVARSGALPMRFWYRGRSHQHHQRRNARFSASIAISGSACRNQASPVNLGMATRHVQDVSA